VTVAQVFGLRRLVHEMKKARFFLAYARSAGPFSRIVACDYLLESDGCWGSKSQPTGGRLRARVDQSLFSGPGIVQDFLPIYPKVLSIVNQQSLRVSGDLQVSRHFRVPN
jgi:hypothetical protein